MLLTEEVIMTPTFDDQITDIIDRSTYINGILDEEIFKKLLRDFLIKLIHQ